PAAAVNEMGRERRLLASVERVREVDRDPEIGSPGRGMGEMRRCGIAKQAVGARLVRLVLDADPTGGVMLGDGPDASHLEVPCLRIVKLEAVIEAVLAKPDS